MITVFSNVIDQETITGLINSNSMALIELIAQFPDSWQVYGYLKILVDDEDIGNRSPIIDERSLTKEGLLYKPSHSFNYHIKFIPRVWLFTLDPLPLLNVYIL